MPCTPACQSHSLTQGHPSACTEPLTLPHLLLSFTHALTCSFIHSSTHSLTHRLIHFLPPPLRLLTLLPPQRAVGTQTRLGVLVLWRELAFTRLSLPDLRSGRERVLVSAPADSCGVNHRRLVDADPPPCLRPALPPRILPVPTPP